MTPKPRSLIKSALESKGFEMDTCGHNRDHDFFLHYVNNKKTGIRTFLSRGVKYKEYSDDLLSQVAKQLRLKRKELDEFIECPLTQEGYVTLLKERGEIKV